MLTITLTKTADVPEGAVCENWAYRTSMPPEQQYRCEHLRRDCQTFTDRDMGGVTDRMNYSYSSRCSLFDKHLSEERGVGPLKCGDCIRACIGAAP